MSKKSNVHPDYYKTAGRDRQDDAAAGRLAQAIAAKPTSQQHPDRMTKGLYFERRQPTRPLTAESPADRAQKETSSRAKTAKKPPAGKPATRKASASRRATPRKPASTGRKKSGTAARPAKKR